MKKLSYWLIASIGVLLAGCFETTQETTINKDGSGIFNNTIDLSNMIGLLKQMGGDEAQKMSNADTTISLANIVDSVAGFTADQKKLISQGTMKLNLNMQDEKLVIKLNLPFHKISDVAMLQQVLPKISEAAMKKMPGTDQVPGGMATQDSAKASSFDDFYDVSFTDKTITKTLNKERYAAAKDGDYMKSLQQMSEMGSPVTANYVINLPRPAKKAEGKAVKLSEDKKKISLTATSDDFFNDPSKFEYHIEY